MNLPNKLSLFRVLLVPVLVLFYYLEVWTGNTLYAYLLAPIFIVASLTDFLDGYLARKNNLVTVFGKFVDPLADKLLVMAALIVLINPYQLTTLPTIELWIPIVILSREFIVTGIRLVCVGEGNVIAASNLGKYKTASTMIALALLLLNPYLGILATIGMYVLYLGVLLTVVSGIDYFIKNKEALTKSM